MPEFDGADHPFDPELGEVFDPQGEQFGSPQTEPGYPDIADEDEPTLVAGSDHAGPYDADELTETVAPPIDEMEGLPMLKNSLLGRPAAVYPEIARDIMGKISNAEDTVSDELRQDLVYDMALRRLLAPKVTPPNVLAAQTAADRRHVPAQNRILARHRLSAETLEAEAEQLPPEKVVRHFIDKLVGHTDFLVTGRVPSNWPNIGGDELMETDIQRTNELVKLSLDRLRKELGEDWQRLSEGHQAWLERTFSEHLARGHVGRAAPLANTAHSEEAAAAMTDRLTGAMNELRDAGDVQTHRRTYRFIALNLQEPARTKFVEQTERLALELTPGAERIELDADGQSVIIEYLQQERPVTAWLTTDEAVEMPYAVNVLRTLKDFGTPTESETFSLDTTIERHRLDEAAQAALELAIQAEAASPAERPEAPHYKRLALSPAGTLHTVALRPGEIRSARFQADPYAETDEEPILDKPLTGVELVADGYMVFPNRGGAVMDRLYLDGEPNLFGPGPGRADGFRLKGNPRLVTDRQGDRRYVRHSSGLQERWIIVPVDYYKVREQT